MNQKPGILSIIQNDSWAAPVLGAFIMTISATTIVMAVNLVLGGEKPVTNITPFIWMTGVSFFASIITIILRIRYVTKVFENGTIVKALVLESRYFKANLKLRVRYAYLSETHEKKLEQVITGKTKKLMRQKEVTLVIDQKNPEHILLWDAYL
jgi:hypothetical protein